MDPHAGSDSPPLRSTILGSFLRGRPRNSSQSEQRDISPSPNPPSPSTGSFAAVAALTGNTGSLITNSQVVTNSGRRLQRQSNSNPVSPNPNSTAIYISIPPSTTSNNIAPGPSSPSAPSTFASMLRRKPNPNPNNATNQANSTSPIVPSASAPHSPQLATQFPSNIITSVLPNSAPPIPSMPGGLPVPGSSLTPANPSAGAGATPTNATFRIRLVPHLDSRRSLRFDAITRDLREIDPALRIGRFTDRSGMGLAAVNALGTNKLAFKSKVVSRAHAEIWVEKGGKFLIKDTKSSSGTFLNHIRLSPANQESRPFPLKDGDILQLGVDYQGGAEDIYKSVKIRVEIGREWQASANAFNTTALKNLKNLAAVVGPAAPLAIPGASVKGNTVKPAKLQIPDCCICLFAVSIRQALFIAPCSHTFHYKCIKPLLEAHHPAFSCPLCRTYADLEEDVEVEPTDLDEDADADVEIDDVPANNKESDAANQSDNAGVATAAPTPSRATEYAQHREDAEMSDGSFNAAPPPLSRPALNPLPPIPVTSGRLLPITERERFHLSVERDREAGGETEVEPDSVGQLSLSSRRVRGTGTGGGGASNARERARYLSTLLSGGGGGGGACTDDEGTGNGNGVDEVDEVEMGDAIEYDGPEEDSAMDEEHDHVGIAVGIVTADGIAELGVGPGGSTGPGGSIGGKRKR